MFLIPGLGGADGRLSRATVTRFSLYLRHLEEVLSKGIQKVSSKQMGEAIGITDAQVRKDLACLGNLGHPGIGYASEELIAAIRHVLGIDRVWSVALVGVGNLGRALLRYKGFQARGFRIVALFDSDPALIGQQLQGLTVRGLEDMTETIKAHNVELGLIAVPSDSAQFVADSLVEAGIRGLLNFAPVVVRVPPEVSLVAVDLTVQLEQLAFHVHTSDAPLRQRTLYPVV
ncbi:MAG: redox-sensing transcriptional repressor Rex [Gemmataceae bacterium]